MKKISFGNKLMKEYTPKPRTPKQNNALHLWYEKVAQALNEGGFPVQLVLRHKMDLDWDKNMVKDLLWRPAQVAILNKKSTTELSKLEDIEKVWEHLNRHFAEKFGIHIPFPSDKEMSYLKLRYNKGKKHD